MDMALIRLDACSANPRALRLYYRFGDVDVGGPISGRGRSGASRRSFKLDSS
jgi:hypothetical protein